MPASPQFRCLHTRASDPFLRRLGLFWHLIFPNIAGRSHALGEGGIRGLSQPEDVAPALSALHIDHTWPYGDTTQSG